MTTPIVSRGEGTLVGTLNLVVLTVAVLQTAVVPVLAVIADQLGASTVDVGWVLTANLLAAAASTPLIGRLADLRSKKSVLMVGGAGNSAARSRWYPLGCCCAGPSC